MHFTLFALLAGTTRWRFGVHPRLLVALAGYAVATEILQGALLRDRSGDPYDVLADGLGAVGGWLVARRLLHTSAGPEPAAVGDQHPFVSQDAAAAGRR